MSGEGRRSLLPNSATRPCVSWPIPDALWPFTHTHTQVAQEALAELRVALTEVDAPTSVGGKVAAEDAAAADSDAAAVGREKPWYRAQHELAARARSEGVLLTRHDDVQFDEKTGEACALTFEMWRSGEDYVALLVVPEESEEAVVASTTFRDGPVPPDMRRLLRARLPAPSLSRKVRGLLQRKSLAGMVHVYTAPKWRGGGHGEALSRFAMHALRKEAGFTHALTLADDRGSGKLREWYGRLGFVGAHELGDTAMVARTDATRRK